ncbi:MAG: hypothetical protein V4616_00410 [Bacteroidota bacterium]
MKAILKYLSGPALVFLSVGSIESCVVATRPARPVRTVVVVPPPRPVVVRRARPAKVVVVRPVRPRPRRTVIVR